MRIDQPRHEHPAPSVDHIASTVPTLTHRLDRRTDDPNVLSRRETITLPRKHPHIREDGGDIRLSHEATIFALATPRVTEQIARRRRVGLRCRSGRRTLPGWTDRSGSHLVRARLTATSPRGHSDERDDRPNSGVRESALRKA